MAIRGLGCPVRFTLAAGQKGDAPQAAALLEGLPAEVVMADTAYDADHLRQAIAAKGAIAVTLDPRQFYGSSSSSFWKGMLGDTRQDVGCRSISDVLAFA